jgi:hypothetical protein
MANRWHDFVRKYAAKNNVSYMCAASSPECSAAYRREYPKNKPEVKKARKEMASMEKEESLSRSANLAVKEVKAKPMITTGRKKKLVVEKKSEKAEIGKHMITTGRKKNSVVEKMSEDGRFTQIQVAPGLFNVYESAIPEIRRAYPNETPEEFLNRILG